VRLTLAIGTTSFDEFRGELMRDAQMFRKFQNIFVESRLFSQIFKNLNVVYSIFRTDLHLSSQRSLVRSGERGIQFKAVIYNGGLSRQGG
jgi:hypothetical protein